MVGDCRPADPLNEPLRTAEPSRGVGALLDAPTPAPAPAPALGPAPPLPLVGGRVRFFSTRNEGLV
jgi:hypothetical protein